MSALPKSPVMTWKQARRQAGEVTDKLGKPMDNGIKETVMTLWMHGFTTSASCAGHLRWGLAVPWVDITVTPSAKVERARQKMAATKKAAEAHNSDNDWLAFHRAKARLHYLWLPEVTRLMDLLLAFSSGRIVNRQNLILYDFDSVVRLIPQSAALLPHNSLPERKDILTEGRQEMNDFTEFLKQRLP